MPSRSVSPLVLGVLLGAAATIVTVVACSSTDDPRVGTSSGGTSGSSGTASSTSSSGGLVDAALPEAPVECGPAPGAAGPFSKAALLAATASCASWHACQFQNAATALRSTLATHVATPSDASRAAARDAWKKAMNEQSRMELFQFGPAASRDLDRYHGRGLRTFVHPWPDLNRCQVETQVVSKAYQQGWNAVFPNSRGLFALEYVLFYEGADTACFPSSTTGQAWGSIAPADLVASKNAYATAVADNVVALAAELRNVWAPEGENFAAKLAAFDGYGSEQETLNVVAWALMYPEQEIKDLKLGSLSGVQTTPYVGETPFAHVEIENVRTNLQAFRSVFQGCSADGTGIGFDDWLVAAGHEALATDMTNALAGAQAAADAFPAFASATQAQFRQLYDAIKPLSDLLKTSFFGSASPLNLKLPASAASDTD